MFVEKSQIYDIYSRALIKYRNQSNKGYRVTLKSGPARQHVFTFIKTDPSASWFKRFVRWVRNYLKAPRSTRLVFDERVNSVELETPDGRLVRYGNVCRSPENRTRVRRNNRGGFISRRASILQKGCQPTFAHFISHPNYVGLGLRPFCGSIFDNGGLAKYCSSTEISLFNESNGCDKNLYKLYQIAHAISKKNAGVYYQARQDSAVNQTCTHRFSFRFSKKGTYYLSFNEKMNRADIYVKDSQGERLVLKYAPFGKRAHGYCSSIEFYNHPFVIRFVQAYNKSFLPKK